MDNTVQKVIQGNELNNDEKIIDTKINENLFEDAKKIKGFPFKYFDVASLKTEKMHLLEIFIAMFCVELAVLIRRGIKSDYIKKEEFKLKPDLLIGDTVVADTKWKLLETTKSHFGISQADLYQMYAYGKKYNGIEEVHLIYPKTEEFPQDKKLEYHFDDKLILRVFAFDCELGEIVGEYTA